MSRSSSRRTRHFARRSSRRRDASRLLWAGAAAAMVLGVALVPALDVADRAGRRARARRARLGRRRSRRRVTRGRPLAENRASLATGRRLRTRSTGALPSRSSSEVRCGLRRDTEVMLDAPGRLYCAARHDLRGQRPRSGAARLEVVTPAGTARDIGTQFELQVTGSALRLRVREGSVALDRGGRTLTGAGGRTGFDRRLRRRYTVDPSRRTTQAWQWAESIAPMPDMDGKPAADADRLGRARDRAPAALRIGARRTARDRRDPARGRAASRADRSAGGDARDDRSEVRAARRYDGDPLPGATCLRTREEARVPAGVACGGRRGRRLPRPAARRRC